MAKHKAPKPRAKATPLTLLDATRVELLFSTTTAWRRVSTKVVSQAVEDAISDLSAAGLLEVRIVAAVEMGNQKLPRCRYVGGGEWWTLLDEELARLIPPTWMGADGKPKQYLLTRAGVTAIRLTSDGYDHNQAVKADTLAEWWRGRPNKAKAYLRCDGIDTRATTAQPQGAVDEDGPVPPDGFRLKGTLYRPLAKGPFNAIAHLWGCRDRWCDIQDLPQVLYGDCEEMLSDNTVRNLREGLNTFFRQHTIPFRAVAKGKVLAVLDGAPRPLRTKAPAKKRRRQRR